MELLFNYPSLLFFLLIISARDANPASRARRYDCRDGSQQQCNYGYYGLLQQSSEMPSEYQQNDQRQTWTEQHPVPYISNCIQTCKQSSESQYQQQQTTTPNYRGCKEACDNSHVSMEQTQQPMLYSVNTTSYISKDLSARHSFYNPIQYGISQQHTVTPLPRLQQNIFQGYSSAAPGQSTKAMLNSQQGTASSCTQTCMPSCQSSCVQQISKASQAAPRYSAPNNTLPIIQYTTSSPVQYQQLKEPGYRTQSCATPCMPTCQSQCIQRTTASPHVPVTQYPDDNSVTSSSIYYVSALPSWTMPTIPNLNGPAYQLPWQQQQQQQQQQQRNSREINISLPQFLRESPFCTILCRESCLQQCIQQGRPQMQCDSSCTAACENTCPPDGTIQFPFLQPQQQMHFSTEYPPYNMHNEARQGTADISYQPPPVPEQYQPHSPVAAPPTADIFQPTLTPLQQPSYQYQQAAVSQHAPAQVQWQQSQQATVVPQVPNSYLQISSYQQEESYRYQQQPAESEQVTSDNQNLVTFQQQLLNKDQKGPILQRETMNCVQQGSSNQACVCPPGYTYCPSSNRSRRRCCRRK